MRALFLEPLPALCSQMVGRSPVNAENGLPFALSLFHSDEVTESASP